MERQLDYFREYKAKLESSIGTERTKSLVEKAAFVICAGTVDIVINYYGTPFRRKTYNITTYTNFLLQNAQRFIQVRTLLINTSIYYIFVHLFFNSTTN